MEDEKVISLTATNTKITLEFLLKMLYLGISKAYELNQEMKLGDRIFHGETEWNTFMQSIDPVTIKDLENNEVNLEAFKQELDKYGIGFSFYKNTDNSMSLAFLVKHKDIVEKALTNTIEKIVKEENLTDKVKKTNKNMPLDEKLNYYKKQEEQDLYRNSQNKELSNIKEMNRIKEKSK